MRMWLCSLLDAAQTEQCCGHRPVLFSHRDPDTHFCANAAVLYDVTILKILFGCRVTMLQFRSTDHDSPGGRGQCCRKAKTTSWKQYL